MKSIMFLFFLELISYNPVSQTNPAMTSSQNEVQDKMGRLSSPKIIKLSDPQTF